MMAMAIVQEKQQTMEAEKQRLETARLKVGDSSSFVEQGGGRDQGVHHLGRPAATSGMRAGDLVRHGH